MSIQNIPAANNAAAVAATTAESAPAQAQQSSSAAVIPPTTTPKALESVDSLRQVAADMEKFVRDSGRNLQFQVDDGTGQVVVRVVDADSGDVIRQIPSEELLRLARSVSSICDECA
jgi:flagellar protein FlaG